MNTALRIVIIYFLAITLAGCATPTFPSVQLKEGSSATGKGKALGVFYSKSFFQERFMGKAITANLILQSWIIDRMWNWENNKSERMKSSDYEKLLGDFDVTNHFYKLFSTNIPKSKYIKIDLANNAEITNKIIKAIQSDNRENKATIDHDAGQNYSCLAAFKISYGFGTKLGEHYGFTKTYRPFIRLIGMVKRADTGEVVWADSIIAFGNKKYVGSNANADRIDKNELISAFKELSKEVLDLSIKSLNGESLPAMPELIHTTSSDLEF